MNQTLFRVRASGLDCPSLLLIPGGQTSDFQIHDFYVDPRMLR